MARTSNFWDTIGTYLKTTSPSGYDILINGTNKYLNFNLLSGSSGYGFRDNAGTLEFKDSGGNWASLASLASGLATLDDLTNVSITTPGDNEVLAYDSGTGNWINQTAAEAGLSAVGHTHTASEITDFDTEVSNNTDVAANTSARHSAVTLTGQDYLALSGQQITANPIDLDNLSATGTPSATTFLRGDNTWATPGGSGNVSTTANIGDNRLVRGDGGSTNIQESGITVDDSDNITGAGTINGVTVENLENLSIVYAVVL